jgi:hypothetical protein
MEITSPEFKKYLKRIARLTDNNCHTLALQTVADMFGLKAFSERFQLIEKLHLIEGSMPYDLGLYRSSLSKELMTIVKNNSVEMYDEIKKAL